MPFSKEILALMGLDEGATEEQIASAIKKIHDEKTQTEQDKSKLKSSFDKTASELATLKKEKAEKMSDEEKKQAEFDRLVEDNKKLQREIALSTNEKHFVSCGYTAEQASKMAKAQLDGDVSTMASIMKTHNEEVAKLAKAEALKGNPNPTLGDANKDTKYTKENFEKGLISMEDMNSLKEKDPALYNSIVGK